MVLNVFYCLKSNFMCNQNCRKSTIFLYQHTFKKYSYILDSVIQLKTHNFKLLYSFHLSIYTTLNFEPIWIAIDINTLLILKFDLGDYILILDYQLLNKWFFKFVSLKKIKYSTKEQSKGIELLNTGISWVTSFRIPALLNNRISTALKTLFAI